MISSLVYVILCCSTVWADPDQPTFSDQDFIDDTLMVDDYGSREGSFDSEADDAVQPVSDGEADEDSDNDGGNNFAAAVDEEDEDQVIGLVLWFISSSSLFLLSFVIVGL